MKVCTSTERLNELFEADPKRDIAIAKDLGVSRQALSAWRTGVRSPKKTMLIKISEMYNVSIEWLMGFDVPRNIAEVKTTVQDKETIQKLIIRMAELFPTDYCNVMKALEKTEVELRKRGEL